MFGILKRRREKRDRREALNALGRNLGESLNAEIALFIEMEIVPIRKAFLDILHGQIAKIEERLKEAEVEGELSREDAAALDVRIMMDNWDERNDGQLQSARSWLAEQYEMADAVGIAEEFQGFVKSALVEQRLILLTDGMAAINEVAEGRR